MGLFIRVPRPLARQFVEDAAAVGNSQSDQMALILATWYGSSPTAPDARAGADMVVLASGCQAEAIAHRAWVGGYLRPANAARWTRTAAPVALIRQRIIASLTPSWPAASAMVHLPRAVASAACSGTRRQPRATLPRPRYPDSRSGSRYCPASADRDDPLA